eukprot:4780866-Pyramimonas_sp.AAC.1
MTALIAAGALEGSLDSYDPQIEEDGSRINPGTQTFAACKALCVQTLGCRGVELYSLHAHNPSHSTSGQCWLMWGMDLSLTRAENAG